MSQIIKHPVSESVTILSVTNGYSRVGIQINEFDKNGEVTFSMTPEEALETAAQLTVSALNAMNNRQPSAPGSLEIKTKPIKPEVFRTMADPAAKRGA